MEIIKRRIFSYDINSDSLLISERANDEKIKENFMLGNFVISFNDRGSLCGLEIREVSSLFNDYGFDPAILNNIIDCELIVEPVRDFIFIGFKISGKINSDIIEQKIPLGYFPKQIAIVN